MPEYNILVLQKLWSDSIFSNNILQNVKCKNYVKKVTFSTQYRSSGDRTHKMSTKFTH